jgi:RNA polymerase sigma-70 factor (ECF subfamily)
MNTIEKLAGSTLDPPGAEDWGTFPTGDAEILASVRAGNESACEAVVRQHGGRMLAVARRFLRTEEDSADAVQDAFLSAFRSLDGFEGNAALATWLHRILVNVCLMKLRTGLRCREVSINDLLPRFDESGQHTCPIRPWKDQALAQLIQQETRAHVRACIAQLPGSHREVLLLRDMEGLDTEETAQLLGINAGAVKTRLHRARQALRTLLESVLGEVNEQ